MAVFSGTIGNDTLDVTTLSGTPGAGHELRGLAGNDSLVGGNGNDRLRGNSGNDTLIGGNGNDQLDGGSGADSMDGGAGNDSYEVDNVNDQISDSDGDGSINAYVSYTIPVAGLSLALRTAGITGTGTSGGELIISYATGTTLNGLGGHDVLKGATGSTVNGGDGNDVLEITGSGTGNLNGGSGDDTYNILVAPVNLRIDDRTGGIDTIFTSIDNFYLSSMTGVNYVSGTLIENLTLAAPGASLNLVGGPTTATGNSANNQIIGNRQDNFLFGLNGNDTIYGSFGNDSIDGGNNDDSLFGEEGNDTLIAGLGTDILTGGNGNDIYVIDSADTVVELTGGGTDTVNVNGSWSTDQAVETINITTTSAVSINLTSSSAGTTINPASGSASSDTLIGGSGNDVLAGGAGIDFLTGGGGSDIFVFGGAGLSPTGISSTSVRQDTIVDFAIGIDKIRLDSTTFTALTSSSSLSNTFGGIPGFATFSSGSINQTNAIIVYNPFTGDLLYNANGSGTGTGGGGNIALLTGILGLAATDFEVV